MKKNSRFYWFSFWTVLLLLFCLWTGEWLWIIVEALLIDRYITRILPNYWNRLTKKQKGVIKFLFWTILYIIFLVWVKSWWGLIAIPFIFDNYITKKIPWGWWKNCKNATVRIAMSWIDAIVFAAIAAYFATQFFAQNYVIPSSSLEKSLLVGDYLLVSKMTYGPRIPNTPLAVPLTSHTVPGLNCKSYSDWPYWNYRRVKGLRNIRLNDIVVFNYPAGDTVASKHQNEDFYGLCYRQGAELGYLPPDKNAKFESSIAAYEYEQKVFHEQYMAGFNYIKENPEEFGRILARPTDRRENYVKRCVGLPGQTLQIKNRIIYLDGKANKEPDNVQYCYFVQFINNPPEDLIRELGISAEDLSEAITPENPGLRYMPLTRKALEGLKNRKDIVSRIQLAPPYDTNLYPLNKNTGWTCHNYGPIWIPKRGATLKLTLSNLPIYERCIRSYEHNTLEVKNGKIYINQKPTDRYTFKMDYYWMMGDNRDRSADSRFWGFVPEDHIVGTPVFIWMSLNPDYGWAQGKIRWNRLFRWVSDIK